MEGLTTLNLIIAIVQLLFLAVVGYFLFKRKVIDKCALKFISTFVVNVSTPALIFYKMMGHFNFSFKPAWWIFFILSFAFFGVGYLLSSLFYKCSGSKCHLPEMRMLAVFQNCGYLPMNIAYLMFAGQTQDDLLIYTMLYLFGFNILIWSVGSAFIYRKSTERFEFRSIFNPPIVATFFVLVFKLIFSDQVVLPVIINTPLEMLGKTTFPLSMIFLGGTLADAGMKKIDKLFLKEVSIAAFTKLVAFPAVALVVCTQVDSIPLLLGFFVVLQASMPSAVNVVVATQHRNGDYHFAARSIVLLHFAAIISVPFWLNLFISLKN